MSSPLPEAVYCPAFSHTLGYRDEVEIAKVHAAEAEDVDVAVQAARTALDGPWNDFTSTERGRLLGRLADLVEANADILGTIEAWDCGECRLLIHRQGVTIL